jgi:SHS2 domain-containing protein
MDEKSYEEVDISGDVGLRIYGESLGELFIHAAEGMYSLITNTDLVTERKTLSVSARGDSIESLLVAFLNELIYHFDTEGFIGKNIIIDRIDEQSVTARISGEEFNESKCERRLLLKAATYHDIHVEKTDSAWSAFVMFDI